MNHYAQELHRALHEAAFEKCFYCRNCGSDKNGIVDIYQCRSRGECHVKPWLAILQETRQANTTDHEKKLRQALSEAVSGICGNCKYCGNQTDTADTFRCQADGGCYAGSWLKLLLQGAEE